VLEFWILWVSFNLTKILQATCLICSRSMASQSAKVTFTETWCLRSTFNQLKEKGRLSKIGWVKVWSSTAWGLVSCQSTNICCWAISASSAADSVVAWLQLSVQLGGTGQEGHRKNGIRLLAQYCFQAICWIPGPRFTSRNSWIWELGDAGWINR